MTDVFHLKVITNRDTMAVKGSRIQRSPTAKQLAFPFPTPSSLFIVNVDLLNSSDIIQALDKAEPRWIFDLRIHPRLDLIAGTRSNAFKYFQRLKSKYIDLFGRIGVTSYKSADVNPVFWTDTVIEIIRVSDTKSGPYVLLMDNSALIDATVKAAPEAIERATGKKVSTTVIAR